MNLMETLLTVVEEVQRRSSTDGVYSPFSTGLKLECGRVAFVLRDQRYRLATGMRNKGGCHCSSAWKVGKTLKFLSQVFLPSTLKRESISWLLHIPASLPLCLSQDEAHGYLIPLEGSSMLRYN
jgi:hypothetical protein